MTSFSELCQRLLHRYYILHLLYGYSYIVHSLVRLLDPTAPFSDVERNSYLALFGLSVWKILIANTAEELASVLVLYAKFFSFCMIYWKSGIGYCILYLIGWFVLATVCPQPWYQGPSKIVELTEQTLKKDVQKKHQGKPSQYWVVMLYANWSLSCLNFEAVLAKLSLKYDAPHLHFGKVDIDIYGDVAETYAISRDPASFDLPTLLLFRDGALIRRLPELTAPEGATATAQNTITRIGWSKKAATVVKAFQLDKVFADRS